MHDFEGARTGQPSAVFHGANFGDLHLKVVLFNCSLRESIKKAR
jgi:hypothetical protein